MILRPYQTDAVASTMACLSESPSVLGVAATGLGKSVIIGDVLRCRRGTRALVFAHRAELVWQLKQAVSRVSGRAVGVEMNAYTSWKTDDVVVGTVQSLAGRLDRFRDGDFATIVVDEAHHALAPSYQAVIKHFSSAALFGLTATPDRSDELAMGRTFDRVAFDYDIDFGVAESWLVPIASQRVPVTRLDFSGVRTTAGDLNQGDLALLMEEEEHLHGVATPTVELTGDKRTLVFAASLDHAERLAEIINRHKPGKAAWLSGETPYTDRCEMLERFRAGGIQYLVNVGVLTEGFDDPGIECIVMARPTKSRALYAQMAGRGTRPLPSADIDAHHGDAAARKAAIASSQKPRVTIIDFVGNVGRHSLVSATDILAGDYDSEIVAKVAKRAESGPVDVAAAMAEEVAERQRATMLAALRERERRLGIIARAEYDLIDVDPFVALDVPPMRSRAWDRGHRARGPLVESLRNEGVFKPETLGEAGARRLWRAILSDKLHRRPTYKQRSQLKFLGVSEVPKTQSEAAALLRSLAVKP